MLTSDTFAFATLYSVYKELYQLTEVLNKSRDSIAKNTDQSSIPIDDFNRICQAIHRLQELIEGLGSLTPPADNENEKQFWSTIRHDLRTPINVINGYSEILLEDLENIALPVVKENLHIFLDTSKKILKSIDKIVFDKDLLDDKESNVFTDFPLEKTTISITKENFSAIILIVGDQEMNRDTLKRRLIKEGYRVVEAVDGHQALTELKKQPIDLVLLDLMMPGISGYEVLNILKKDEALCKIPVIMVSAISEIDKIVTCIEAGAEDYLTKPFDPVLLRARINSC